MAPYTSLACVVVERRVMTNETQFSSVSVIFLALVARKQRFEAGRQQVTRSIQGLLLARVRRLPTAAAGETETTSQQQRYGRRIDVTTFSRRVTVIQ